MAERVTRFAPSPTGPLHLGHAYAALVAAGRGDRFLLRIEDIDRPRCKSEYESSIYEDLHWLGLSWDYPVMRQSERLSTYDDAIAHLYDMGLTYHCQCSRGDIKASLSAPQENAPILGPDGLVYPGICRSQGHHDGAIRLNMARAVKITGDVEFFDSGEKSGLHRFDSAQIIETIGDIVLARRDIGTSYHVAVVVDDAAQGITEISRGEDLFEATAIHVVLQRLLGLPTPRYHHHRLIRDSQGKRLAKRDDARALSKFRAEGQGPDEIRRMLGL